MSESPALSVTELSCGYDDLEVVRRVTFSLEPGRICAMFGRNGAGKSTTLRGIAGLNKATHGSVLLSGEDVTGLMPWERARRGLGLVLEGKRVFRDLTVQENLQLSTAGLSGQAAADRIARIHDRFPILAERRNVPASTLSGGQQQLLAVSCALMLEPSVILIDEPSSGLAPIVVDEILSLILELRDQGMAVLLVEQLVDRVLGGLADDVILLDAGKVVRFAPASEVSMDDVVNAFGLSTSP